MPLWNFIVGASLKAHATSCFLDVGGAGEKRLYNYDKLNSCAARSDPLLKCGFLRAESLILLFWSGCVCTPGLICRFNWATAGAGRKCKVLRRTLCTCFIFIEHAVTQLYARRIFRAAGIKTRLFSFFMGRERTRRNESKLSRSA